MALLYSTLPPVDVAGSLALYSMLTTVIPFLLFTCACSRCGSLSSLLITSLEPVLATVWAVLFFGEQLNVIVITGCALVFSASILSASDE